jgi:hypothetical protein
MRVADFKAIVAMVLDDEPVYQAYDKSTGEIHLHNWTYKQKQREGRL